jgi:hypothetical protein
MESSETLATSMFTQYVCQLTVVAGKTGGIKLCADPAMSTSVPHCKCRNRVAVAHRHGLRRYMLRRHLDCTVVNSDHPGDHKAALLAIEIECEQGNSI